MVKRSRIPVGTSVRAASWYSKHTVIGVLEEWLKSGFIKVRTASGNLVTCWGDSALEVNLP
jgi:hypothetical protein